MLLLISQVNITDEKLFSIANNDQESLIMIRSLIIKAHRHADMSIHMLKICKFNVVKPL